MIQRIRQPDGSSLCGQCCVAMAAGVSLAQAIEATGHNRATSTSDVVKALRALGLLCADRCHPVGRVRPSWTKRAMLAVSRQPEQGRHRGRSHWLLAWDGEIFDPQGDWPTGYDNWRVTSYLEICS